jgi:hypothetical protein
VDNYYRPAVFLICTVFLISGCASTGIKQEAGIINKDNTPTKQEIHLDSDAVVVTAKRLTRLEKLKKEATRRNNGDSVQVVSGAIAAIIAYNASGYYFGPSSGWKGAVSTLCITAASAYAAAFVSGSLIPNRS